MSANWEVGLSRVDITPTMPLRLSGYGNRTKPSEGVDTPLNVRCMAMRTAGREGSEAGMVIEAFSEPKRANKNATPGDFRHRGNYIAPYYRIKARKVIRHDKNSSTSSNLWVP